MRARMLSVLRETVSRDKLEPTMRYESPTGRAVVDKLPVIMQQAGEAVQGLLPPMLAKVQGIMKDTVEQLKAAEGK
jgi:hypothetical protein